MDLELIKKLVKIVDSSGITDFAIEEGDLKIKISKKPAVKQVYAQPMVQQQPVQAGELSTIVKADQQQKQETPEEAKASNLHEIRSPIVGTFYRAPSPDAEPFVKIGDTVSSGKVMCIIEAMKLMNEIESDISGKVVKILVDNGRPVEYNQPLFLVEV